MLFHKFVKEVMQLAVITGRGEGGGEEEREGEEREGRRRKVKRG